MLGDSGVGKTAFVTRYVHDFFSENPLPSTECEYHSKDIEVYGVESRIQLDLYDVGSQHNEEECYKNVDGAIIVFDVSKSSTFESLSSV